MYKYVVPVMIAKRKPRYSDFASKSLPVRLPLYRVEKILTISNYIVRKVGRNYTQCEQRIFLRLVTPHGRIDDLTVISIEFFQRDPLLGHLFDETRLFVDVIPSFLEPPTTGVATRTVTDDPPAAAVSSCFPTTPAPLPVGLSSAPVPLPHQL